MSEVWKPIVGFDRYDVSSEGRIRNRRTGRILRQHAHTYGHMRLGLRRDNKNVYVLVHRAVAEAFLGEPTGRVTRHLNGVPSDNRVENLAWGTDSENRFDAVTHGTHNMSRRTHCKNGHEFTEENTKIRRRVRVCRTCGREANARMLERKRSA